ncbi:MAG: hypothetical protein PVG71_16425 [Anaerolineae bacterium]|jgi:hypothetical protein
MENSAGTNAIEVENLTKFYPAGMAPTVARRNQLARSRWRLARLGHDGTTSDEVGRGAMLLLRRGQGAGRRLGRRRESSLCPLSLLSLHHLRTPQGADALHVWQRQRGGLDRHLDRRRLRPLPAEERRFNFPSCVDCDLRETSGITESNDGCWGWCPSCADLLSAQDIVLCP